MASGRKPDYTGPSWVGKLYLWLLAGFVLKIFVQIFMDTEQEWECYGDDPPTKEDRLNWRVA